MLYRFTGFTKLKPAHPLLFVSFEGEEGNSLVNDSVTKLSDSSLNQKNLGVNKKFEDDQSHSKICSDSLLLEVALTGRGYHIYILFKDNKQKIYIHGLMSSVHICLLFAQVLPPGS